MSKPLRVGLIGAGWVTQHHLAGWARLRPDARVVAIADPQRETAQARAKAFDIPEVFTDARTMLDTQQLDAVDIAAPREFHDEYIRMAADRGLAILCQKPLAPNYERAAAAAEYARTRCRLMVHENWRFREYYRVAAQWIASGRIGEVVQGQMELFSSGLVPDAEGRLPALERQPFIGTLDRALVMEILIHHIDTLRFLLGDLSLAWSTCGRRSDAMRGEDYASLVFRTARGSPVVLQSNLSVHGRSPALADRLTLVGTQGTLELEGNRLRCIGDAPMDISYDMGAAYLDSYASTIAHFVQCLNSGKKFETDAEDNLRTLELVESIYGQAHD